MVFEWPDYVGAFLASALLSWFLTPLMLRVALRMQILDAPDERKAQQSPVPYLGGLAIVLAFSLAVLVAAALSRPASGLSDLFVILGLAVLLSLMGLIDDLRGLGPFLRLLIEGGAALAIWANGSGASITDTWFDAVLTVVWIVAITNAFNLLDNMDGLSAGIAVIASLSFFAVAVTNGQFLVAALTAGLAGCALGFLRHNFHPARIYMGDAGSLFLGFMLAVIATRIELVDSPPVLAMFVPVLVLGVALFDTTLVTVHRLLHGRSPLSGGRDHVSHRLVWVGIPVPVSVSLIYAAGLGLGWLALVLARIEDSATGLLLVGFTLSFAAFAFVLLGRVPVYANSRQRQSMLQMVRMHEPEPPAGVGSDVEPAEPINRVS